MNKKMMSQNNKKGQISKGGSQKRRTKKRRRQKRNSTGKSVLLVLVITLSVVVLAGAAYFLYVTFGRNAAADLVQKGTKLMQEESYQEAVEKFEAAVAQELEQEENGKASETAGGAPYITEAYRGLGMAYYELQDYEQAGANLQQVIDLGGEVTPVLYNLRGLSAMYQADYDTALTAFEAGVALPAEGSYTDADKKTQSVDYSAVIQEMKFNRIVCFEKKLDWESAKVEMEAYIAEYPDDESAQKEAEFLATR